MAQSKVITIRLPVELIAIIENSGTNKKDYIKDAILLKHGIDNLSERIESKIDKKIDSKFEELLEAIGDSKSEIKSKEKKKENNNNSDYFMNSISEFI